MKQVLICENIPVFKDYNPEYDWQLENNYSSIRLDKVRYKFINEHIGERECKEIERLWFKWMKKPEYLPLKLLYDCPEGLETEYGWWRCVKRGDKKYSEKMEEQLGEYKNLPTITYFDENNRSRVPKFTRMLRIVLTSPRTRSIRDDWEQNGIRVNRYIANIRKHYGKISVIRAWHSHDDYYCHVDMIVYFHKKKNSFRVLRHVSKKTKDVNGFPKVTFRLPTQLKLRKLLKERWEGHVDITGIANTNNVFQETLKYVMKEHDGGAYTKTLAMCWFFRKRSFSISRDFIESVWGVPKEALVEPTNADSTLKEIIKRNSNQSLRKLIKIEIFPPIPAANLGLDGDIEYIQRKKPPDIFKEQLKFLTYACSSESKIRADGVKVVNWKWRK